MTDKVIEVKKQKEVIETAHIYYDPFHDFITGYRCDYLARYDKVLISGITFNATVTTYTSRSLDIRPFRQGLLLMNIDVSATPTDIVINLQFSDDNENWYKYMRDAWGDMRYEDTAGDLLESFDFMCLSNYLRLYVVATGTTAVNMFKLTCKVSLLG